MNREPEIDAKTRPTPAPASAPAPPARPSPAATAALRFDDEAERSAWQTPTKR